MKKNSPLYIREHRIINSCVFVTGLIVSLYGYFLFLTNLVRTDSRWLSFWIYTVLIVLIVTCLYFWRGRIFRKCFSLFWHYRYQDRSLHGKWIIQICLDESPDLVYRTGMLKIEDTFSGLKISGSQLQAPDKTVHVDKWFSQNAELYHFQDKVILVYHYFIQDNGEKMEYSKLGTVTAESIDRKNFVGRFMDLKLKDGEVSRRGLVKIWKDDDEEEDRAN